MSTESPIARECEQCGTSEAPALTHRGVVLCRLCDPCAESLSDSLNNNSEESIPNSNEFEKIGDQRPEGGTSRGAGTTAKDMLTNTAERQNCTDSTERADSWREVYIKMGVFEVGHR